MDDKEKKPRINFNYWGEGDKTLSPSKMWDDGLFTYLKYANVKELPAVFKIQSDGSEALVNSHIKGDTLIIHEVEKRFILRLGKSNLTIENKSYSVNKPYNRRKTSDNKLLRLNKKNRRNQQWT